MKLGATFEQTVRHYFPDLNDALQELPDSRLQPVCTYETRFLAWWGLLLFILKPACSVLPSATAINV